MRNIFSIFHYAVIKHKKSFVFFLLGVLLFTFYTLSKINLSEDISILIPKDERIAHFSKILKDSKFADQLIISFSLQNTLDKEPEKLIKVADYAYNILKKDTQRIKNIRFKTADNTFFEIYDFIYNHLPLYLDESDYELIEANLHIDSIDKKMAQNYKTLTSLMGIVTKDFVLKDPLNISTSSLKKLERFQIDDNFVIYQSCVFTADLKHLMLFIEPIYSSSQTKINKALISNIENALRQTESQFEGIHIEYYGGTAVAVENANRIKKDIILTVTIALLLLVFVFFIVFRSLKNVLILFIPILFGILISISFLILFTESVSAISLGIGAILIGISLDYSLHAFTHFRHGSSIDELLKSITTPVIMSALSTALAFATLYIVQSEALNQLGLFAALAIVFTALTTLTLLPFLLKNTSQRTYENLKEGFLDKLAAHPFHKNRKLLMGIFVLSVIFVFSSQKLTFNGDISKLNYLSPELYKAEESLNAISNEASSAVYFFIQGHSFEEVLLKTEQKELLFDKAKNDSIIGSYSSSTLLMPSLNTQKERIERWNTFWEQVDRIDVISKIQKSGMAFHFKEDAFKSFYTLLNKKFVPLETEAFSSLKDNFLSNYLTQKDSSYTSIIIAKVNPENKKVLFDLMGTDNEMLIFDNQFFTNSFLEVLKDDFRLLVSISMLLVFGILLVFFGRIEIALITFFPILLSWIWTIGIMGLFGISFNIFNIIISTFILGLGVDYSIFIMSGMINNYTYGTTSLKPYKLSVLLSAITTIICLGVLVFAKHPALKSIAVVSIVGISSVILITYTVLPVLFNFIICNGNKRRIEPVNMLNFSVSFFTLIIYLLGVLMGLLLLPLLLILPIPAKFKKGIVHYFICYSSKFIVFVNFMVKTTYINKELLNFDKPVVFVSNHQSHLDLVLLLLLSPKMIVLTNNWVWNSPFFGGLVRYVGYYPAFKGLDYGIEKIKEKVKQGYSVLIFPEGSRTTDGQIKRFHQGAFYIADKLELNIQPIIIHGAMQCLSKNEFYLKSGRITLTFFERQKVEHINIDNNETYNVQAKKMTQFYRTQFESLSKTYETPLFYKPRLITQYIYKGPVLEWYMRIKIKLENYYDFFDKHVPRQGKIMDIGCGYGFMSYMLYFLSNKRLLTGLDYDTEKIETARHCAGKTKDINFVATDVFEYPFTAQDAFILSDVLHYFNEEKQEILIRKCISHLNPNGKIIIRDADKQLTKRHWGTRYTEFFSTTSGFNLMKEGQLYFTSREKIESIINQYDLSLTVLDNTKLTSNIIYIIQKK